MLISIISNMYTHICIKLTCNGNSFPGIAGVPVIKSLVTNGLRTTERWHEGIREAASRSKCMGIKTTGI